MPTAIVTGATGILGREIVFALGKDSKWTKVHALSRSQKDEYPSSVQHDKIDLTGSAEEIAKQLKDQNVEADYLFFAAYLAKDDPQEACDVNGGMLANFLDALKINGVEQKLKRVILTTGAKQYGVHLGPVKLPMSEDDPWVEEGGDFPPNFYYTQQRILHDRSSKSNWDWVVTYPNDVIGVAKGNFMNLVTSLALYAVITKELGTDFIFPGSEKFYTMFDSFTSAILHAQFNLWAATEPRAGNHAFNVVNGDAETWANLWPRLAKRFGLVVPRRQFELPTSDSSSSKLAPVPPIARQAKQNGLEGRIEQGQIEARIDLVKWSKKPLVKKAWDRLAEAKGLEKDTFDKATWDFLGFVLGRNYNCIISMSKARKFGWTGYVDTWDAFEEAFDRLASEKMVA